MLRIEPLSRRHDREGFDCGNPDLNDYLRHTARQHTDKGLSRTEVLVDNEAPAEILGYVTVGLAEIITDTLPPRYARKYPSRAHGVKLARLAVARSRQRQGLGALMMIRAVRRALQVADSAGIIGLFVDAKDAAAGRYYRRFGFIPLPDDPQKLFLPLATLRQALGKR
jgi:GNAT superfamily N-acetyltransferase